MRKPIAANMSTSRRLLRAHNGDGPQGGTVPFLFPVGSRRRYRTKLIRTTGTSAVFGVYVSDIYFLIRSVLQALGNLLDLFWEG